MKRTRARARKPALVGRTGAICWRSSPGQDVSLSLSKILLTARLLRQGLAGTKRQNSLPRLPTHATCTAAQTIAGYTTQRKQLSCPPCSTNNVSSFDRLLITAHTLLFFPLDVGRGVFGMQCQWRVLALLASWTLTGSVRAELLVCPQKSKPPLADRKRSGRLSRTLSSDSSSIPASENRRSSTWPRTSVVHDVVGPHAWSGWRIHVLAFLADLDLVALAWIDRALRVFFYVLSTCR